MPTARQGASSAVINGKLYVVSGCCSTFNSPFTRFTQNEVYDPATNTWAAGTETAIPTGVYGAATAYIGGKLYVVGGSASPSDGGNILTIQIYDPSAKTWSLKSMPGPVSLAGSAVLNGKLYMFGGMSADNTVTISDARVYDPSSDTWTALTPMSSPRSALTATAVNGKIYVAGGISGGTEFASTDIYDPATNSWTSGAPMPSTRYFHAATELDGILYVVGGLQGSTPLSTVLAYDPAADTWTPRPSMPTARFVPVAQTMGGMIYVLGGATSGVQLTNAVEETAFVPLAAASAFETTTTNINFDSYPVGTAANTLYCSSGVEFRNFAGFPVPIYGWQDLGRQTTSQPNVIATVTNYGGRGSNFLDLLFTSPRTEVGAYFGNDQGVGSIPEVRLSVFDASGAQVGSVSVIPNGNTSVDQFIGLRSAVPFTKAHFENMNEQFLVVVLDDVRFTTGTPPASVGNLTTLAPAIDRPFSGALFNGALYVADPSAHTVWKIDLSTQQKVAVAGTGEQGFNGDGIDAKIAQLDNPTGVAIDPLSATLYIADSGNHAIRAIVLGLPGAVISTVAGIPTAYAVGESTPPACANPPTGFDTSQCTLATSLRLFSPRSVAVDAAGNVYIADRMNQQVKKLDKATGFLYAIAGVAGFTGSNDGSRADCAIECGAAAKLNSPVGVAVDATGNVYVADEGNNKVRMISAGFVSTVDVGTLLRPTGVAVSPDSAMLYVADYGNNRVQRRSLSPNAACSVQTVAGTGVAGDNGDGGPATSAQLNSPIGIALDASFLYIADLLHHSIRKVDLNPVVLQ